MAFLVLVLCQIRAGVNDMCETFKIFVAKPTKWSFTGIANAILHWNSSNNLFLWVQMRLSVSLFSSPFLNHSTFYFHCGILFPLQIVHVALFPSTVSIGFLSFLSCSHWHVLKYSVLTLIFIFSWKISLLFMMPKYL